MDLPGVQRLVGAHCQCRVLPLIGMRARQHKDDGFTMNDDCVASV